MPSMIKKAIGAVKDQTSISLAKVTSNNATNLEVTILKATSHDKSPIDDRYVNEILQLVASDKTLAAACAHAIAKRIGKTHNWIVALKSLMLVLRVFQDGDQNFPREVLHAMKHGAKILNLLTFRDYANASSWDYTALVRTFSLYLGGRLDCFLMGMLQKRYTHSRSQVCDLKPNKVLDNVCKWQCLLDRAIGTRPTGAAKNNRLVQICLHAIVQETFDLYRDISDGLALILDGFFHLQYQYCVLTYQSCMKANKQFEELSSFFEFCKSLGIGRSSEYPSVQKISEELLDTLKEFLKDESTFPSNGSISPLHPPIPHRASRSRSVSNESYDEVSTSELPEKSSDKGSEYSSTRTSSEYPMGSREFCNTPSPSRNIDQDHLAEQLHKQFQHVNINMSVATSSNFVSLPPSDQTSYRASNFIDEWHEPQLQREERIKKSSDQPAHAATSSDLFCDRPRKVDGNGNSRGHKGEERAKASKSEQMPKAYDSNSRGFWELDLVEGASQQSSQTSSQSLLNGFQHFAGNDFFVESPISQHYNPFLDNATESNSSIYTASDSHQATNSAPIDQVYFPGTYTQQPTNSAPIDRLHFPGTDTFSVAPTFQAFSTFSVENPGNATAALQHDPFASGPETTLSEGHMPNGCADQESLLHEQKLWLQNQKKIIEKHMVDS